MTRYKKLLHISAALKKYDMCHITHQLTVNSTPVDSACNIPLLWT